MHAVQQMCGNDTCDLFRQIPIEKLDEAFEHSETVAAEADATFLGFEEVYKAVTLFVPKSKIIIDLGCSYAFQAWYFRDYKKYIGVDSYADYMLQTENAEYHHTTIQRFIQEIFPTLGISKEQVFTVCSYVPDEEARQMVKEFFPYCLVYYPTKDTECRPAKENDRRNRD